MRHLIAAAIVLLAALSTATADETRIRIGDVPRTGSHFVNPRDAALVRANAATGGIYATYLNPAACGLVEGTEGFAAIRFNSKTRDYLPDGETSLDASDDGMLFSEAVAVKSSGGWTFGFSYATPAYRSVDLTGTVETGDRSAVSYEGEFSGSFRAFEAVLATRIGSNGQGIFGISAGVGTISEAGRVVIGPELEESWEIDGLGATYGVGFIFRATKRIAVGVGYRFGSEIDVEGTGRGLGGASGTFATAPVATGGITVAATDALRFHASVVRESWDQAKVTLDPGDGEDPDPEDVLGAVQLNDALLTVAFGAEFDVSERIALRAGYSMQTTDGIEDVAVPEYAFGAGGTYELRDYYIDAAYVRESFELNGESGQITNNGLYVGVGYTF